MLSVVVIQNHTFKTLEKILITANKLRNFLRHSAFQFENIFELTLFKDESFVVNIRFYHEIKQLREQGTPFVRRNGRKHFLFSDKGRGMNYKIFFVAERKNLLIQFLNLFCDFAFLIVKNHCYDVIR